MPTTHNLLKVAGAALLTTCISLGLAPKSVAQDVYNWRMQSNLSAGEPGYVAIETMFIDKLRKMSDGRMNITLHPVGSLFPLQEGLEAVNAGIVEIGMMAGGYFSGKMGPIAALEMGVPGAERNALERYSFFYNKGFIDIVREAYAEQGVYYLAPNLTPPWDIMSTTPIRSVKDFEGLKIRSTGSEAEWFEALGASAVILGGSAQLYSALSTGVVDAVRWGSPAVNHSISLHEVAKYYLQPSALAGSNNHIVINGRAWEALPEDIQTMMDLAARAASLEYMARGAQEDTRAVASMKAEGVEFTQIPAEEWHEVEMAARASWEKFAEHDERTARAVELLKEYLKELGR